jgi:TRAP-type transport system periplasmic protein
MKKLIALVLTTLCLMPPAALAAETSPVRLQFVMAHKPDNQDNVGLIQAFADRVKERTKGAVEITPTALQPLPEEALANGHELALGKVYTGEIAMSQISVKKFSEISPVIDVLDMPMLFRSHEHASQVLDGKIGADLRESVRTGSNGAVRGLAFTYSGGYRDIYSTKPIASVSDLKGMKMRLRSARSGRDAMAALGLDFFSFPPGNDLTPSWIARHAVPEGLAEEAELNRIIVYKKADPAMVSHVKTVLETRHSLFLTLLVVHGPTFDKLTSDQQQIVQEEANRLAKEERELSISQEAAAKKQLEADGVKFVALSAQDKALLEDMGAKVQNKYRAELGKWFEAIKNVDGTRKLGSAGSPAPIQ